MELLWLSVCARLTILMEELVDGSFLWVEEQRGHVIVGLVGAEELADGWVDVLTAGQLKTTLTS